MRKIVVVVIVANTKFDDEVQQTELFWLYDLTSQAGACVLQSKFQVLKQYTITWTIYNIESFHVKIKEFFIARMLIVLSAFEKGTIIWLQKITVVKHSQTS